MNFSELVSWPEEGLLASSRPLLFLITLSIKKDWVRKKKIKLTFLKLFDNPLSKYLTFKRISCLQRLF